MEHLRAVSLIGGTFAHLVAGYSFAQISHEKIGRNLVPSDLEDQVERLNGWTSTLIMLSAIAPDIDVIIESLPHRSDITHSFLGGGIVLGIGSTITYAATRNLGESRKDRLKYALYVGAACASSLLLGHLFLDVLQGGEIRFWFDSITADIHQFANENAKNNINLVSNIVYPASFFFYSERLTNHRVKNMIKNSRAYIAAQKLGYAILSSN